MTLVHTCNNHSEELLQFCRLYDFDDLVTHTDRNAFEMMEEFQLLEVKKVDCSGRVMEFCRNDVKNAYLSQAHKVEMHSAVHPDMLSSKICTKKGSSSWSE